MAVRSAVTSRWEITLQALRVSRRRLAIWAGSFAGLIALYAVIWPSVRGNTSWRNLFDTLPETYRALFTASGTIDLSTAGGYLGVELMGFMGPALIAVYAITTGAGAIAGEEDLGGLEVTLSAPISRARVFAQRCAALVIGVVTLMAAVGATLWIFSALLGMGLGLGAIASGAAALGLFGLFTGAVAIAVGAATGSAAAARGLAALAAVLSYLINALAQITSVLRPARPVSPYYLVLGNEPLANGLRLIGAVSVLGAAVLLAVAGGILFTRRDLS
ncbi:MAG TPA: ABC transporter permease subunit [Streptosporangiaceae bacterium]